METTIVDERNIGKIVTWESQAFGRWITKTGKIVGICPEHHVPIYEAEVRFPGHRLMFDCNTPVKKGKERYFIEVRIWKRKPMLYYPRLKCLEIQDDVNY